MSKRIISEVRGIPDPIKQGIASGWDVVDAASISSQQTLEADVIIIGTGAGGGMAAEVLSDNGLKIILVEEGPLKSSDDFNMEEHEAQNTLYQERSARATKDQAIKIMQGRCVGGTTVVNYTSSFRTPAATLDIWQRRHGIQEFSQEHLQPWFEKAEQRMSISPWPVHNENNQVLARGSQRLGHDQWGVISRNVSGCWNLGYCAQGCPTNAKKSILVTSIPHILNQGAKLVYNAHVRRLSVDSNRVTGVEIHAVVNDRIADSQTLSIKADTVVVAAGAINSSGLLIRSAIPDPYSLIGKRTFLHPLVFSIAAFGDRIDGFYGAPQSMYSDHFISDDIDGPMGFKLETVPVQPGVTSLLLGGYGDELQRDMSELSKLQVMMAVARDGFHEQSVGGSVSLSENGSPLLDYPLTDYLKDGFKRGLLASAEIQFAAGAKRVKPAHVAARWLRSWKQAKTAIAALSYKPNDVFLASAHVMGGVPMGKDYAESLLNSECKYHYLDNLYVMDGSVFPTSIGANPQLSIYAMAMKQAAALADKLKPSMA